MFRFVTLSCPNNILFCHRHKKSWSRGKDLNQRPPGYRFAPPCGARKNLRAYALLDFFDRCAASGQNPLSSVSGVRICLLAKAAFTTLPFLPNLNPLMLGFRFVKSVKKEIQFLCGRQNPTSYARRPHNKMNIELKSV